MKQAERRKFHYIYKITRTDGSGKFYIGMHSTDDLEDGYFGSGQLLWKSINKHGKEKHSKEILEHLPSREALKLREREIVNEELLGDKRCMNLKLGGEGGWDTLNAQKRNLYGSNGLPGFGDNFIRSGELKTLLITRGEWESHKSKIAKGVKKTIQENGHCWQGKTHTAETVYKLKIAAVGKQDGEKNSQYGSCWVTINSQSIKIRKEQLDEYLRNGYLRGRK